MPFQETEPHDLVAAYALDAVDDEERMAFERHLETCEQCRTELVTLRDTAASLAYAPGAVSPPPELRERILGAARDERSNVVPLHRRSRTTWVLGAATAVAAGIAIALGIWNISLSNSLDSERSTSEAMTDAIQIVAEPTAARHQLSGASGTLVVASSGRAALVLCDLPKAPSGKTYQAWVLGDGDPASAGVFDSSSSCVAVPLEHAVPGDAGVAITVEPDGGSALPSTTPIIRSQPA